MSGHGGSGGGSGLGGGFQEDDCLGLIARTVLNSPDPSVLDGLKANDVLELGLQTQGARAVIAKTTTGEIAGSITVGRLAQLARCLEEGEEFIARVVGINGGHCEVEVRPAVRP